MDIVTYALLKKQVDNVTLAYTYKGSVASVDDFPNDAETGDLYTVGTAQYVYDGTQWLEIGGTITNQQIDNLFTEV